jgi:hypothetical protein
MDAVLPPLRKPVHGLGGAGGHAAAAKIHLTWSNDFAHS